MQNKAVHFYKLIKKGLVMSGYTEKDAAKETGASNKEVNNAWHTARDDAAKDGGWGIPKELHICHYVV